MSKLRIVIGLVLLAVVAVASVTVARWLAPKGAETRLTVTVQSIRKVAQLATVEYRLSTLVEKTFRSSWGLGTCDSSKMLAYYTGTVKGSIDLERIEMQMKEIPVGAGASDKGSTRRRATIHFPEGSIVIKDVALVPGEDSMRETVTWVKPGFAGPNDDQREAVRREALETILETALKQGIVTKTKDNARTILAEFLAGFGIEAEVTFDENAFHPDEPSHSPPVAAGAKH